jgi:regulator of protease activity HflC (stomatin/prohibitin superfamily)
MEYKGEWKAEPGSLIRWQVISGKTVIADIYGNKTEANAHLIAAALVNLLYQSAKGEYNYVESIAKAQGQAQKAIAKAEGKS